MRASAVNIIGQYMWIYFPNICGNDTDARFILFINHIKTCTWWCYCYIPLLYLDWIGFVAWFRHLWALSEKKTKGKQLLQDRNPDYVIAFKYLWWFTDFIFIFGNKNSDIIMIRWVQDSSSTKPFEVGSVSGAHFQTNTPPVCLIAWATKWTQLQSFRT